MPGVRKDRVQKIQGLIKRSGGDSNVACEEKEMMTRDDVRCYRINYDKKSWYKHDLGNGFAELPLGTIDAIHALCDEIDRLRKWKKTTNRIIPI